jgi:hypothetical protein
MAQDAAKASAQALGLPNFAVILVEHPIQPLTADEVHQGADVVFDRLIEKLTGRASPV